MQIRSWYTEHSKPLPRLFFCPDYVLFLFKWAIGVSEAKRGQYWDGALGKKKWGKVSGPEQGRAEEESRCPCRGCGFTEFPPPPPPLASHWRKGLRQVSLDSFSWSRAAWSPGTLRPREGISCLSGPFYFLPVLSLSSSKQTKESGWTTVL